MSWSNELHVRAQRCPMWHDGVDIHIAKKIPDGAWDVARPFTFERVEPGFLLGEPVLRLSTAEAQALMDELWGVGVRPTNGEGAVGQIGAIKEHLEDMRRLVFNMEKDGSL